MIDTNKPIIDTRSVVIAPDGQAPIKFGSSTDGDNNAGGAGAPGAGETAGAGATSGGGATSGKPGDVGASGGASRGPVADGGAPAGASYIPPIATTIPDQFKGNTNQELIDYLERKIGEYKPLSEADLEKIRRRQKAEGVINGVSDAVRSVANLIATHNYAPNMYDAANSMSAKARARFEKEKADRQAEEDKYFNYAITLGRLRNEDRDRGLQAWQIEQNMAMQNRAFEAGRQDRADDVAFRNKDYDERLRQWQAGYDREGKWHDEEAVRWEKQFTNGMRQFNISAANERSRIGMEAQRLAQSMKEGQMTFNLGSGNGNVTLSLDKLNAQTVSRIYSTLPNEVRANVQGDPIVQNGFVVSYKPPTTEAMLIAIGANVESSPATQNAIRQVAGLETGQKPAGY